MSGVSSLGPNTFQKTPGGYSPSRWGRQSEVHRFLTICGCVDRSVRLLVNALLHEETEGLGLDWTKL